MVCAETVKLQRVNKILSTFGTIGKATTDKLTETLTAKTQAFALA